MRLVIFSSAHKHWTQCSAYINNFRIDICHPILDVVYKLWLSDILNSQSAPEQISLSRWAELPFVVHRGGSSTWLSQLSEMKHALPLHKHRRKIHWHQISIDVYSLRQNWPNSLIYIKNTKIMFCFRKIFKSVPHPHPPPITKLRLSFIAFNTIFIFRWKINHKLKSVPTSCHRHHTLFPQDSYVENCAVGLPS